jgi:putative glutamine amidotransferase
VRVSGVPAFAYGVQWHPEWQHQRHPFYERTLRAFAEACREHMKQGEEA